MDALAYLQKAFLLAQKANPKDIRPNPFVGAIIVDENGVIKGEGYHKKLGEAHAEVYAIQEALENQTDLTKSTLYVTLEPCSHFGKTPPCSDLILQHKLKKVVIGSLDPNPKVSGAKILSEAGIEVEMIPLAEIEKLNQVFIINQQFKRPRFILKTATTVNGSIADRHGNSKWISSEKSRQYVHTILRTQVDAILTSAKTILQDNAKLNIRIEGNEEMEQHLIILDKDLSILEHKELAIFYKRTNTKIYLVTHLDVPKHLDEFIEIIQVPLIEGHLDLTTLSKQLLEKNICEVLIEAGGTLNGAFISNNMVDELNVFICPKIITDKSSINAFESSIVQEMKNAYPLELIEVRQFDSDLLLKYNTYTNSLL
jgi:diaminohydroxyphosphoribosylaminopyrimidine deaminase/5-amino-6-(5-phosphoribosylamino)uracil reductase